MKSGEPLAARKLSDFSKMIKESIDNLLRHCPESREEIEEAAKQIRLEACHTIKKCQC